MRDTIREFLEGCARLDRALAGWSAAGADHARALEAAGQFAA
jgi:hypothetical protein